MAWLFDILKDGNLVDNQTYSATAGVISSRRMPPTELDEARKRTQLRHREREIWEFLAESARKVGNLQGQQSRDSVVFFNDGDYEHNTDDPLFQLIGAGPRDFVLKTGNLIGQIRRGPYSIKISSRFGDSFLKYIIADADGFLEVNDFGGEDSREGYDWLLIYLWRIKLQHAWQTGLPKGYVSRNDILPLVRGRLDPTQYFLQGDRGVYKCDYREHSYCNPVTVLIAETFRRLKSVDAPFIGDLHALANSFYAATDGRRSYITELLETKPFKNPYYSAYNSLIELSKRLLKEDSSDFGAESDASAFFFDVSMLFEYFVRKQLFRNGARLWDKGNQWRIPAGRRGGSLRNLIPDLVFSFEQSVHLYDVKYKYFDFVDGVAREDLFQLHTYLGQCPDIHELGSCGFIYPLAEQNWDDALERQRGCLEQTMEFAGKEILFRVIFLKVPKDGEDFVPKFSAACARFCEIFEVS